MNFVNKSFKDLTNEELYRLMALRCEIFIVEQECPYQDLDFLDQAARHLYLEENGEILAYLRVLEPGTRFDDAYAISRVIAKVRRKGYASDLIREGLAYIKKRESNARVRLSGQYYARDLYKKFGFEVVSGIYLEDGIEHLEFRLDF